MRLMCIHRFCIPSSVKSAIWSTAFVSRPAAACHVLIRAVKGTAALARKDQLCPIAGINCGVMLFRNSGWSKAFLEQLWSYAHLGDDALQDMHSVHFVEHISVV